MSTNDKTWGNQGGGGGGVNKGGSGGGGGRERSDPGALLSAEATAGSQQNSTNAKTFRHGAPTAALSYGNLVQPSDTKRPVQGGIASLSFHKHLYI